MKETIVRYPRHARRERDRCKKRRDGSNYSQRFQKLGSKPVPLARGGLVGEFRASTTTTPLLSETRRSPVLPQSAFKDLDTESDTGFANPSFRRASDHLTNGRGVASTE